MIQHTRTSKKYSCRLFEMHAKNHSRCISDNLINAFAVTITSMQLIHPHGLSLDCHCVLLRVSLYSLIPQLCTSCFEKIKAVPIPPKSWHSLISHAPPYQILASSSPNSHTTVTFQHPIPRHECPFCSDIHISHQIKRLLSAFSISTLPPKLFSLPANAPPKIRLHNRSHGRRVGGNTGVLRRPS